MRVICRVRAVDVSGIKRRADSRHPRVLAAVTEAVRMDTLPYVPWVTGALAGTANVESKPTRGLLVYGSSSVPYARAQYYTMPNKTRTAHPQATMQWFEASAATHKRSWRAVAGAEYRREFGGH